MIERMARRRGEDGGVGWSSNNSRGSGKMASSQAVWGLPPGSFTVATYVLHRMQGGDDVGDEVGQCLLLFLIVVSHGTWML